MCASQEVEGFSTVGAEGTRRMQNVGILEISLGLKMSYLPINPSIEPLLLWPNTCE